jgi:hypothetical protein
MSDPGTRPVLTPADVQRSRELMDEWVQLYVERVGHPLPNPAELLGLRGMVAAALTDARLAGYAEGYEDGQKGTSRG